MKKEPSLHSSNTNHLAFTFLFFCSIVSETKQTVKENTLSQWQGSIVAATEERDHWIHRSKLFFVFFSLPIR
ncbi:unnamed protein product, partial [Vitis vinifera]|uniref:Uncharacterized protein n=1 Tax=Vitis vinifera TaxID=29760 RepID=D7TDD6_VITVI